MRLKMQYGIVSAKMGCIIGLRVTALNVERGQNFGMKGV